MAGRGCLSPECRDTSDLPVLLGGKPPLPYDPNDTDSDFDDLMDEEIDW